MSDYDALVKKVISDPSFCNELVSNPEATLRANGIEPTPAMLTALAAMKAEDLQNLASAFGNKSAAAG